MAEKKRAAGPCAARTGLGERSVEQVVERGPVLGRRARRGLGGCGRCAGLGCGRGLAGGGRRFVPCHHRCHGGGHHGGQHRCIGHGFGGRWRRGTAGLRADQHLCQGFVLVNAAVGIGGRFLRRRRRGGCAWLQGPPGRTTDQHQGQSAHCRPFPDRALRGLGGHGRLRMGGRCGAGRSGRRCGNGRHRWRIDRCCRLWGHSFGLRRRGGGRGLGRHVWCRWRFVRSHNRCWRRHLFSDQCTSTAWAELGVRFAQRVAVTAGVLGGNRSDNRFRDGSLLGGTAVVAKLGACGQRLVAL